MEPCCVRNVQVRAPRMNSSWECNAESSRLTVGQHLSKKYLGKSADLTLARLEHIAGTLHA